MTTMNRLLWQDKVGVPGAIHERPLPTTNELDNRKILVKAHAWAMNPCDSTLQTVPLPFITYPVILGQDVAGTVEAVQPGSAAASKVQRRRPRLRLHRRQQGLSGICSARLPTRWLRRSPAMCPTARLLCSGCALGTTGSFSLFGQDFLNLGFPMLDAPKMGRAVLVWGGSSAAGSNAIRLAVEAGYRVVTTCSPRNFDYLEDLGASGVFDYSSSTVAEDVVAELGDCAGIYMAAGSNAAACKVSAASKQNVSFMIYSVTGQ